MLYRLLNNIYRFRFVYLVMSVSCAATVASAQGSDSLTVEQAVQKVLQNSHSLKKLNSQIGAAGAKINEAQSAFLPTVAADLSYANIGPMDNLKMDFEGMSMQSVPMNNYDAHVGANIVLYDFGKRKLGVEAAKVNEKSMKDQSAGITSFMTFQTLSIVTNIAMLRQGIEIQNENITSLQRHLDLVKKRVETGTGTDYDVLKTEAQLSSSRAGLLDIENGLQKLRITLATLMGVSVDSLHPVKITFDSTKFMTNTDSLISVALNQRTEIISAKNAITGIKVQREIIGKENTPNLGAAVSAGFKDGFPNEADIKGDFPRTIVKPEFNYSAGIQLHIPIYDGARKRYHASEAEANLRVAEESLSEANDKVKSDILQAVADVNTAYAKLSNSILQVNVNKESLRLAKAKLEAGTITNDDLLDTQNDYTKAQLENLQDLARYTLNLYALDQATGKSVVKN